MNWLHFVVGLTLAFSLSARATEPKKVLMIINEGFMAPEYLEPRQAFDQAGFRVTVAAKHRGEIRPDIRNTDTPPVNADLAFTEVDVRQFDAITFAGGNGAWTDYFPDVTVHKILTDALASGMPTGLICTATGLLGIANNFDGQSKPLAAGRHVTGYYRVEGILRQLGKVRYDAGEKNQPLAVVDGNLITARDPISAKRFGEVMVGLIKALTASRASRCDESVPRGRT